MNKTVYFVRHGESLGNATSVRLGGNAPLTEQGKVQAEAVAKRFCDYEIDRIVSSSYQRAHHTAKIISSKLGLCISDISELFIERRFPSEMMNRPALHPENEPIWKLIEDHYHIPDWHYSDEENFMDLKERAERSLCFLESLHEDKIIVTSHGLFMKVILAHVLLGKALNARIFWDRFLPIKNLVNTGIMQLEFADNYQNTAKYWKLVSWNDAGHLE